MLIDTKLTGQQVGLYFGDYQFQIPRNYDKKDAIKFGKLVAIFIGGLDDQEITKNTQTISKIKEKRHYNRVRAYR